MRGVLRLGRRRSIWAAAGFEDKIMSKLSNIKFAVASYARSSDVEGLATGAWQGGGGDYVMHRRLFRALGQ